MNARVKHEHSWHQGQINHNWQFQKTTPRTAREAFGHSLDTGRPVDVYVGHDNL